MAVGQLPIASLFVDGKPLDVVVEVAADRTSQRRGLLGRDHVQGAMWFPGVRSVHTVKMRCAIDVAQVDQAGKVMGVRTMQPNRIGSWRRNCAGILEAAAGAFATWGITPGTVLSFQPLPTPFTVTPNPPNPAARETMIFHT